MDELSELKATVEGLKDALIDMERRLDEASSRQPVASRSDEAVTQPVAEPADEPKPLSEDERRKRAASPRSYM